MLDVFATLRGTRSSTGAVPTTAAVRGWVGRQTDIKSTLNPDTGRLECFLPKEEVLEIATRFLNRRGGGGKFVPPPPDALGERLVQAAQKRESRKREATAAKETEIEASTKRYKQALGVAEAEFKVAVAEATAAATQRAFAISSAPFN